MVIVIVILTTAILLLLRVFVQQRVVRVLVATAIASYLALSAAATHIGTSRDEMLFSALTVAAVSLLSAVLVEVLSSRVARLRGKS